MLNLDHKELTSAKTNPKRIYINLIKDISTEVFTRTKENIE